MAIRDQWRIRTEQHVGNISGDYGALLVVVSVVLVFDLKVVWPILFLF